MKNQKQKKHGGKIRRNRRVRPKVTLSERWHRYQPYLKKVRLQIGKVTSVFGTLIAMMVSAVRQKLRPATRLRRVFIVVGKHFRNRSWPIFEKSVIFCTKRLKRAVSQKNRSAVVFVIKGIWHFFVRQMTQTPQRVRHFALFLGGKKGPRLKYIRSYFDPSAVRTEDADAFSIHTWVITGSFAGTVMGAVLLICGAAGLFSSAADDPDTGAQPSLAISDSLDNRVPTVPSEPAANTDGTADFYNPFYVFTSVEAARVSAYPLADPPGIVVDVHGLKEPEASAEEMIGKDDRVLHVRRLVTTKGLRYIIRTSQSMKRIKSQTDGNVITLSPIS